MFSSYFTIFSRSFSGILFENIIKIRRIFVPHHLGNFRDLKRRSLKKFLCSANSQIRQKFNIRAPHGFFELHTEIADAHLNLPRDFFQADVALCVMLFNIALCLINVSGKLPLFFKTDIVNHLA